jgi:restriction endonuclease S subunit
MKRSHLEKGNILMSIVGAIIGNISLVRTDEKQTCSCKLAIFRPRKGVNSTSAAIYLKTRYAQNQIQKFRRGAAQTGFLLEDTDQIVMPEFSDAFHRVISNAVSKMDTTLKKSKATYIVAESHLLSAIGMNNFSASQDSITVKSFSKSFGANGRLDAEYYQRKYEDMLKHISGFDCKKLGDIVSVKKSIEPGSDFYGDEGVPFVRVSDITKFGIQQPAIRIPGNLTELRPVKDTILLSKDGSVGIAYKVEDDFDYITSSALLHLTVTNGVLPDYLTLVLNSVIVQMQAERDAGGSIIQHWKPSEIEEVVIPIVNNTVQQQIAANIQESFELRRQSEFILNKAKCAVEIAIEDGEDKAMVWLDKEVRTCG